MLAASPAQSDEKRPASSFAAVREEGGHGRARLSLKLTIKDTKHEEYRE